MELEIRVDKIDDRLRIIENSNSTLNKTMKHLSHSLDNFVDKLDKREQSDNARFNKLTNIVYIGIGGLLVFQFFITNGIIKIGG
jgi:predicted nuclease with TOPRIM domain